MQKKLLNFLKTKKFTPFQIKVLSATLKIPKGKTETYQGIACAIGHPKAYRAVGTALRKNPFPITIPCHRVIKSDGTPGKYAGGSPRKKIALLKKEGYHF